MTESGMEILATMALGWSTAGVGLAWLMTRGTGRRVKGRG